VGSELTVRGSKGDPVRLRLVAALRDSIFQGELLISESNFLRNFPEHEGYRFFLLDAPPPAADPLARTLRQAMADYGVSVESTRERLEAFHEVENTYLSTFQSLGALGLILGTLGLAAVLLRNVLERRQELALMRSIGYRRTVLAGIVLSENLVLVSWGLVSGLICALIAVGPALAARGGSFPFMMAGMILLSVFAAGALSSVWAVVAAFRSPLLAALRSE
jgi:ABC-type antimicrobial peptide transport system permease subunit